MSSNRHFPTTIVKKKQILRSKVRWPGIDKDVENLVNDCVACQATGPAVPPPPAQITDLPTMPWRSLHVDFCGPFPTSEILFVVIDEYSRFAEVEIMRSTNAQAVIPALERILATHGLPEKIISDSGPPFQSQEFAEYMKLKGVTHHKVTPLWPQANGLAESFMKPLTKAVRTAKIEGRDWRHALYPFLLNYRSAPHSPRGVSPAELSFNRARSNGIPTMDKPPTSLTNSTDKLRIAMSSEWVRVC